MPRTPEKSAPAPRELQTSLDPLFKIRGSNLYEIANPSLEVLSAQINASDYFTIGPANRDLGLTSLEELKAEADMLNRQKIPLIRIVVGRPGTDIKQDYLHEEGPGEAQELKFARVLSLVAEYDRDKAQELLDPLAKELLVERAFLPIPDTNDDTLVTEIRPKAEIEESIDRLRAFGRDFDPNTAELYNGLADKAEEAYSQYKVESDDVVRQTSDERRVQHVRSTRPKRLLLKAGALASAGVGVWGLLFTGPGEPVSESVTADASRVAGIVDNITQTENNLNRLSTVEEGTDADQKAIERLQRLSLATGVEQLNAIQIGSVANPDDQYIQTTTQQLKEISLHAIADGDLTVGESVQLSSASASLTEQTMRGQQDIRWAQWGIAVGYGLFGAVALLASRRFGGKKDKRLMIYKEGGLTESDSTPSPAVNSEYGLNLRQKVIYTSEHEDIS